MTTKAAFVGMVHDQKCIYSGRPVGPPGGPDHSVPLSARLCICDPHGDKARQRAYHLDRYRRSHVLWQDEVWYPREGGPVRVEDMSLRYKRNVIAFLERRAPRLKAAHESELALAPGVQGEHALDAVADILDETMAMRPTTWLYGTPLVKRLEHLVRIEHDGPVD